ncbi:hypothetical protein CWB99_01085 [Pseudoalteromonas rubra]|uniref:DUF2975 domain-containing protein n=1 Tax=Pseudoalteromonas rubra TaxID=43658 RepID=A0A5S3WTF0_9GAMM|nr:hypothetical protein [Pseudoalteromonas rubra]TMP28053.1 hypothetical protein CWC00_21810 [Pseudoalteromonas rubra]TMP32717.1 hypothetical protein CWB99_01085 [Pseudoalteromonas rubra]
MVKSTDKIQRWCGTFRAAVLGISGIVISFLAYQLIVNGQVRYLDSESFDLLWQSEQVGNGVLFALTVPLLAGMLLSVYWIIRLMKLFSTGLFFHNSCYTCYLGFIWTKIALELYSSGLTFSLDYWYHTLYHSNQVVLKIPFGELMTLGLFAVVAYLLKAAKEIEDENKEFI